MPPTLHQCTRVYTRLLSALAAECTEPSCSTQERGPTDRWRRVPPSLSLTWLWSGQSTAATHRNVDLTDRWEGLPRLMTLLWSGLLWSCSKYCCNTATVHVTDLVVVGFTVVLFKVLLQHSHGHYTSAHAFIQGCSLVWSGVYRAQQAQLQHTGIWTDRQVGKTATV